MRNPLRTQGGVTGLGKKGLADKGGSARPEFTGVSRVGCSGHGQGLHLAQKGFVAREVLTGARVGRRSSTGRWRRWRAAADGAAHGDTSRRGISMRLDPSGRCAALL